MLTFYIKKLNNVIIELLLIFLFKLNKDVRIKLNDILYSIEEQGLIVMVTIRNVILTNVESMIQDNMVLIIL
jgi:hypothetical protein